jgi:hypothetical protein
VSEIKSSFELDKASKASLFAAFKEMDDNSKTLLRTEVASITGWMAEKVKEAAVNAPNPKQTMAVAKTVRAVKDRLPYIKVGGERTITSTKAKAGDLLMGSEFGGPSWFPNGGRRFYWQSPKKSPRGNVGYWIFPTLRENQAELTDKWHDAVEKYVENPWGRNG